MPKEKNRIEDILGDDETGDANNPETAIPGGEENPLEKMDKISKAKPQKKDNDSKVLDDEVITDMLKTGENTDGMFEPKKEEDLEKEDDKAKVKVGKDVKPSEKYENQFKDDILKHPDEYKVMTPRGEMTVTEAIRAGYNPITKSFEDDKSNDAIREKHLSGLNDADRAALEKFTDPANAQVAPADAEKYGLMPGSPMIKQPEQPQGGMPMPAPAPTPLGGAMPGAEESMAPGGTPDIAALLGGGQ